MFYAVKTINRSLLSKIKKSLYGKDKVFYKYYLDLEDKNVLYKSKDPKKSIPLYTPFVELRKDIDRSSALYSTKASFELMHADIVDIRAFSKSAVHPKYCLLAVDLFTSKNYSYPKKSRHLVAQKMELFYWDIYPKREQVAKNERMRLETDLKFQQNEIKRLNEKYNVEMFSSRVRGGKAYTAEQKIREFKKLLFKSKKATRQLPLALDSIRKSWCVRQRQTWSKFSLKNTVILSRQSKKM